ncbi:MULTISPECIES: hypothetical protein [unclassified Bradyrhizobium]
MTELAPEVVDLLRAGAADHLGYCCRPSQVVKLYPAIQAAERAGYVRFIGEHPWITEAGRKAIGAPTQAEADRAKLIELCSRRKKLVPAKRDDPRTDFDYRSYKSMDYVCTLLVKQPDARENPSSIRVGRSLSSDPQFLGPRNSIILPESEGRFVLAIMPAWLVRKCLLPTYPFPLDEEDPAFTADERATWDRLRLVCHSVNARIRGAGRRQSERFRYGESA